MIRIEAHFDVIYGQVNEVIALHGRMNEVAAARGWAPVTLWALSFGRVNSFVQVSEYSSLADAERESNASLADPEWMSLVRESIKFVVPGSARVEPYETVEGPIA